MPWSLRPHAALPCAVYHPETTLPEGIVVFLHGSGECGRGGQAHLRVGLPVWVEAQPERWPVVVVAPHKPTRDLPWHHFTTPLLGHLDAVATQLPPGRRQVALTGLSQGGNGALRIGAAHPHRFVAVAAVCGFARFPQTEAPHTEEAHLAAIGAGLARTPTRLFHGEDDDAVPVSDSHRVAAALRARGGDVALQTWPGVGHACWDEAYGRTDLAEWLVGWLRR